MILIDSEKIFISLKKKKTPRTPNDFEKKERLKTVLTGPFFHSALALMAGSEFISVYRHILLV